MSAVYLGNLTVKELERKVGCVFSDEERNLLEGMRCDDANNIPHDKFHIFDIPLSILCGNKATVKKVFAVLKPYAKKFTQPLRLEWQKKKGANNED